MDSGKGTVLHMALQTFSENGKGVLVRPAKLLEHY